MNCRLRHRLGGATDPAPEPEPLAVEARYWWYVLRQSWPEGEPAAWHKDLLLAGPELELIREIEAAGTDWPEELEARYVAISEELDALWRQPGGHALLHHLSAVFGYREVEVIRREPMRF